ncbi:MAG TPA: serine/threonine-protein kinase [Ktedonobacterales bacterium]|jgi:serine/threonine protein kinase
MSVCLNPQGRHPAPEALPQRFFCAVPGCGYLLEGARIGKYRISGFFSQGPASTLYLASKREGEIAAPRVIIKVLHPPIIQQLTLLDKAINQLLALNHPQVHRLEGLGLLGQTGPLYIASPFQEQGSLARLLSQFQRLSGQATAAIVRQIAEALHSAHEVGIVHGRLKPENCLLAGPATVQVTDFYNQLLVEAEPSFSPLYMAPEQAYDRLGPASDQYALAALAFHLLTGQAPFTGPNRRTIIAQHIQNDPPLINSFRLELPRQVDATIRRAMSKRPNERFSSILAFAVAFQSALESRPGATGPLNPLDEMALRPISRPTQLPAVIPEPPPPVSRIPSGAIPLSMLPGHTADIAVLNWAPDGMRLASAGADQSIFLWSVRQKVAAMLARYETRQSEILAFCWAPDGKFFATSANDATITLWEAPDIGRPALGDDAGKIQKAWWGHDGSVAALDWSADSTRIASGGSDRTVRLWDKTGKALAGWQAHGRGGVTSLAWSADSQMLASGGGDRQIQVWDPTNGSPICICNGHNDEVRHLAWSPDGNMLASAAGKKDMRVLLWNPHTGQQIGQFNGHTRQIIGMFWAQDGTWLATAGADRRIRFWNTQREQLGQQVCRPIEIDGTPLWMAGAPSTGLVALSLDTMSIMILQLTWR